MSDSTSYSRAGPGEGVNKPENVSKYNLTRGGKRSGLIIRWDGNGYDRDTCWIRADSKDIISLNDNE